MRFRLIQKAANKLKTTFHVLNANDDVVGSINVKNEEASDLLRHWAGPSDYSSKQQQQQSLAKAFAKLRPMSKGAILRGC
jgi:hypothetical protein